MDWSEIIGQEKIIELLKFSIKEDRVSHAQIFYAPEGSGGLLLAFAYARELLISKGNAFTAMKVDGMQHPDLQFIFPTSSTEKIKADKVESKLFLPQWRVFLKENPYGNLTDWLTHIKIEKKQGIINVRDAETIINQMALKSYEGGYKVTIIWLAENMNSQAANKLLKIIEEPPENTVFLLVTEDINQILPTILSRCQLVKINAIKQEVITNYLVQQKEIDPSLAVTISVLSEGSLNAAIKTANNAEQNIEFQEFFIRWVRHAFIAKTNIEALQELVYWTNEISTWGREKQKKFIVYCISIFREALLSNYKFSNTFSLHNTNFNWNKFSSYIHGANIEDILEELNTAHYHIERNVNAKSVFLDTSIKITRYLHKQMT